MEVWVKVTVPTNSTVTIGYSTIIGKGCGLNDFIQYGGTSLTVYTITGRDDGRQRQHFKDSLHSRYMRTF